MFLRKFIHHFSIHYKNVTQLLLTRRCVICGFITKKSGNLCNVCLNNLPSLSHHCSRCATFLPVNSAHFLCGACLTSPPPFDKVYTLFPYQTPIPELIMQLKFQHQLTHAKLFSDLFLTVIPDWYRDKTLPDLIIPVPLHPIRLRERGFNQSLEIIKASAKKLAIPIDLQGIKRVKNTIPQRQLPAEKRDENMKNAFFSEKNYQNLSIAIVDDVITTGHTVRAISHVLRAQNVANIDIWCCARR